MKPLPVFSLLLLGFVIVLTACAPENEPVPQSPLTTISTLAELPESISTYNEATAIPGVIDENTTVGKDPHSALVTLNGISLVAHPVNLETLDIIPGYEALNLRHAYTDALSPDGNVWAVITYPNADGREGYLHLIDLVNWIDSATSLRFARQINSMLFSPDGAVIIATRGYAKAGMLLEGTLWIINPETPEDAQSVAVEFYPREMQFSLDGNTLFLYGNRWRTEDGLADSPVVMALDVGTGDMLWLLPLQDVKDGKYVDLLSVEADKSITYQPGVAFSDDGRWLYLIHADDDRLTTVDLSAGSAETVFIGEQLTWFEQLLKLTAGRAFAKGKAQMNSSTSMTAVLSPDGTRLYVTGYQIDTLSLGNNVEVSYSPMGLGIIGIPSGNWLVKDDTKMAAGLSLSPDGRWLYLTQYWRTLRALEENITDPPGLEILDAETLEAVAEYAHGASQVYVDFSTDGAWAFVTTVINNPSSVVILKLDTATNQVVAESDIKGYIGDLILTSR